MGHLKKIQSVRTLQVDNSLVNIHLSVAVIITLAALPWQELQEQRPQLFPVEEAQGTGPGVRSTQTAVAAARTVLEILSDRTVRLVPPQAAINDTKHAEFSFDR